MSFIVSIIVLALESIFKLSQQKLFNGFLWTYNIGLIVSSVMMAVRGWLQTQGGELSRAVDASVSGMAGVGHILLGVGIVLFFFNLKGAISSKA